jgi:hypothetical protein
MHMGEHDLSVGGCPLAVGGSITGLVVAVYVTEEVQPRPKVQSEKCEVQSLNRSKATPFRHDFAF